MNRTRKGFTLVELLIVIVVIGILAAMMMLSSNEAVSSARANNIATNLRNLKTAALAYYNDNMASADKLTASNINSDATRTEIFGYLDGKHGLKDTEKKDYAFGIDKGRWYAQYNFGKSLVKSEVKAKLAKRAKTNGLLDNSNNQYNGGDYVRLYLR